MTGALRRVAIGLGANLGDRAAALAAAAAALVDGIPLHGTRLSAVHETSPIGPPQPAFLNQVLVGECAATPRELLRAAHEIESRLGRVRGRERFGPRAIDIDLLAVGDARIDEPGLVVPHPRIAERRFVLEPWAEVDPDFIVAGLGRSVAELLASLIASGDRARVERWVPDAACGSEEPSARGTGRR